jgi:hypothetical protein
LPVSSRWRRLSPHTEAASTALDEAVLALICAERLPFRLVESPRVLAVHSGARAEASRERALVSLPHRTTFSRRVEERFAAAMARVASALEPARHRLSCTFDLWSNSYTQVGFLAVLVSWIDDNWCFHVAPIAMEPFFSGHGSVFGGGGSVAPASLLASSSAAAVAPPPEDAVVRHDAANIFTAVVKALARVGIDNTAVQQCLAATTDNGAKVVKTARDELVRGAHAQPRRRSTTRSKMTTRTKMVTLRRWLRLSPAANVGVTRSTRCSAVLGSDEIMSPSRG